MFAEAWRRQDQIYLLLLVTSGTALRKSMSSSPITHVCTHVKKSTSRETIGSLWKIIHSWAAWLNVSIVRAVAFQALAGTGVRLSAFYGVPKHLSLETAKVPKSWKWKGKECRFKILLDMQKKQLKQRAEKKKQIQTQCRLSENASLLASCSCHPSHAKPLWRLTASRQTPTSADTCQ